MSKFAFSDQKNILDRLDSAVNENKPLEEFGATTDNQTKITATANLPVIIPRAQWKINTERLLENYYWVGMMSIVTFYALFFDDLRIVFLPKSADIVLDFCTLIAMTLYLVELILGVLVIE